MQTSIFINENSTSFLEEPDFSLTRENPDIPNTHLLKPQQENEYLETSIYWGIHELINLLEKNYNFENAQEIKPFLFSNADLLPILIEAPSYIYQVFGRVPIYLELHSDPEEDWDELFIIIKTNLSAEESIKYEKELFDKWFCKIINKVGTRLNFTEEPL